MSKKDEPKLKLIPALLAWHRLDEKTKRELRETQKLTRRQRYEREGRRFWAAQDKWNRTTPALMVPSGLLARYRPWTAQQMAARIVKEEVDRRVARGDGTVLTIFEALAEELQIDSSSSIREAYYKK